MVIVYIATWLACGGIPLLGLRLKDGNWPVRGEMIRWLLWGPLGLVMYLLMVIFDLFTRPAAEAPESTGNNQELDDLLGLVHVGYRIIAVKEAAVKFPLPMVPALGIVLAKKASGKASSKYVVWEYVGHQEFRHGAYRDDRTEAEKIFESRS